MAERGTYRAVKTVLLDGPDFQELPERARHLFLTLKLSFGPAGIEVHYPEALAFELAAKTGMPTEAVKGALDALEAAGWIERERNVLWIVGQLQHEPHFNDQNAKHRTAVQSHIGGLPRLAIVRRFIERYSPFFTDAEDSLSHSLPDSPSHSPSKQGVGSRDEGIGMRDTTTVDKSTEAVASKNGSPPPIEQIPETGQRIGAYLAHFMPILREVGLSDDATNGSILKALAKRRAPPRDLEDVIRGLPLVAGELNEGELRWIYAARKEEIAEPAWNKAKRAYHESQKGNVASFVREMVG